MQILCRYMGKKTVSMTIDEDIHKRATEKSINLSAEVEGFLKRKFVLEKKDLPEEVLEIRCSICRKYIDEGFLCREGVKVICLKCHENWDFVRNCSSFHEDYGGQLIHEHIRFPGFNNKNEVYAYEVKKVSKNG